LVFDAGYNISKGYVEITYTMGGEPHQCDCKINWFGAYEHNTLSHHTNGDIIYVRAGQDKYGFSRMKASGKSFDATELEKTLGVPSMWIKDDSTIQKLKLSWNGKYVSFEGVAGRFTDSSNQEYPVDKIRYGFVGGDNTYGASLIGLRVLTFKMVQEKEDYVNSIKPNEKFTPQIYINPISKKITLFENQKYNLELFNINGSLIKSNNNSNEINVQELPFGIYLLRVSSNDYSLVKKIILN